jgi:hypothetical protein
MKHGGNMKGIDGLGQLGAVERIILKWVLKKQAVEWNHHIQGRPQLQAVMNCWYS